MEKKPFVTRDQVEEIVKSHPTPFYIYDEAGIRRNCEAVRKAFSWNKGYREGKTGKSIGKQILNYTTYDEASHLPIGAKAGCIRVVLLWVDFAICYIGVLWPLWDVKKQTFLSDRFTSAIVLKD